MDEEVLRKYLEAGRIAAEARDRAVRLIEAGRSLKDICEYAEETIVSLGAKPAFPCNISVNEIAAHYSPLIDDKQLVPEGAVVKLDIGAHVDGYIADTAVTVALDDKYEKLLVAVKEALEKALEAVAPGVKFSTIGRIIEETIKSYGFKPISNLSGHSLGRYTIHAGESIPNVYDPFYSGKFQPGKAYAIEPFGTMGAGKVVEADLVTIYALHRMGSAKRLSKTQRNLLRIIYERFRTLPFNERWLKDLADPVELRQALKRLSRQGYLISYPVLVESRRGIVAQFEHTIIVLEDQVLITTRKEEG
ncbi:MAG: type II methionyl aminopeptidase [Pyrodictiaceae archaeon]